MLRGCGAYVSSQGACRHAAPAKMESYGSAATWQPPEVSGWCMTSSVDSLTLVWKAMRRCVTFIHLGAAGLPWYTAGLRHQNPAPTVNMTPAVHVHTSSSALSPLLFCIFCICSKESRWGMWSRLPWRSDHTLLLFPSTCHSLHIIEPSLRHPDTAVTAPYLAFSRPQFGRRDIPVNADNCWLCKPGTFHPPAV